MAVVLLVLAVVAIVAWMVLKNVARARVETNLAELGFGEPTIRRVSLGANGVSASDISFARNGESLPWITLQELVIEHPLSGLAAGDNFYDRIAIEGLRAIVDLQSEESAQPFDLSEIDIPAKRLTLSNATLALAQSNRPHELTPQNEFVVNDISASIEQTSTGIELNGKIGDLAGSTWKLAGEATASKERWKAKLSSDQVQLVDGQWQTFPGMPEGIGKHIQVNLETDAKIELTSNPDDGFQYEVEAHLKPSKVNFPKFNLPFAIHGGKVTAKDDLIEYHNLSMSTDGEDAFNVSGSTSVSAFPIQSTFDADFSNLDVETLRKLATAIPPEVTGKASGHASGSVDVENDLRTTVVINGKGNSSTARFGSIIAQSSDIDVQITPLIFDRQQAVESIGGSLTVTAKAERQSAADVFSALELDELERQLEIEADASGRLRLKIPFSTAEKIETWEMSVSATAGSGKVSKQPVRDIRLEATLENGLLDFTDVVASPVAGIDEISPDPNSPNPDGENEPTALLHASIQWPLSSTESLSDLGVLNFQGQNVPTNWLVALIDRQIQNTAGIDQNPAYRSLEQLTGQTTFQTALNVDANAPTDMLRWSGEGTIVDSTMVAAGQRLSELNARLGLQQGVLTLSSLQGNFEGGGNVSSSGEFNLAKGSFDSAKLTATSIPLRWIAGVAAQLTPAAGEQLNNIGLGKTDSKDQLDGQLSAQFELLPKVEGEPLALNADITSKRLTVKGEALSNVSLAGRIDANSVTVDSASAKVGDRGVFDLSGNWSLAKQAGEGRLKWERLPIKWLANFTNARGNIFTGSTSGNINFSKRDDDDNPIAYLIDGAIRAEGLKLAGLKMRTVGFKLRTVEDALVFDEFQTTGDMQEVDVAGKLKLKRPFAYELDGTIKQLSLAKIFALPSVTEKIKSASVTGIANGKFGLQGNLEEMQVNSTGDLALSKLNFNGKRLSDISATWNHLGSDWKNSTLSLSALGGKMKMTELSQLPERIKVELTDVDAQELTTLASLPTKLTGIISGDASLNDWGVEATRWADFNLRGASILTGNVEIGDFSSAVAFRDKTLKYSAGGRVLNGRVVAEGSTAVSSALLETELPVNVQFTNGSLNQLHRITGGPGFLRSLQGSLAASADLKIRLDQMPSGTGSVKLSDLTYNGELVTRRVSTNVKLEDGNLNLENLRADLKRGEISGKASIPITTYSPGTYELDVRSFDLQRFLKVAMQDPIDGVGLIDSRITGRIGQTISGQGSVSVNRAAVLGLSGRTLRLPIHFQYQPSQQSAKIEFRRSRFQVFNGKVTGKASIELGRSTRVDADLKVSNLETDALLESLAGLKNSGQGKLSGRLKLNGNYVNSARDLKGSFTGNLDRANAFQFPLLESFARFLGGNQLQSRDFESKDIDLRLSNGRIEVRRLNISNALAQVAFSGNAYLDGRLDLDVAARIERVNQPTLVDQLLGSPLTRFTGSPVAFFAQASNFLSDRLVLVQIRGTFERPVVRLDAGKQLQEETIRYFLRGSQILPNRDGLDN